LIAILFIVPRAEQKVTDNLPLRLKLNQVWLGKLDHAYKRERYFV